MRSEFDFITELRRKVLPFSKKQWIGDDCAVISKDKKTDLVITADLLVEDIDFRREWMIPEFLGHKALAVSLSDVAAMGAKPVWAMLSIGIPEDVWKTDFVEEFYDGWLKLAAQFNVQLIGGDVSKTPDKIVIDSIVAGEIKKSRAILRSTAKPGDLIFMTGELGGADAGLKLLENDTRFSSKHTKEVQHLLLRQLRPQPQLEIGRILSKNGLATSMIDLSDGISGDLRHLCRESKVGAEIFADKIPVDKNIVQIEESLNVALGGGEDFELLFTVNPKNLKKLQKKLKTFAVTEIGKITSRKEEVLITKNRIKRRLISMGYEHFDFLA